VLLFESHLNRPNGVGDVSALCNPPVHRQGNNYVYLDGHVRPSTVPVPIAPLPRSINP
jgi:prepilin-type processing-associated H-X9-DG protein